MTTKHTPGPWTATARDDGEWDIGSRPWAIATVAGSAGDGPGNKESDANARLIAAAPDLLAAAEEAIEALSFAMRGTADAEQSDKYARTIARLANAVSEAGA